MMWKTVDNTTPPAPWPSYRFAFSQILVWHLVTWYQGRLTAAKGTDLWTNPLLSLMVASHGLACKRRANTAGQATGLRAPQQSRLQGRTEQHPIAAFSTPPDDFGDFAPRSETIVS
jgi:hypothetical protein